MDITEARKLKEQLEYEIETKLIEFSNSTGLIVKGVWLDETHTLDNRKKDYNINLQIEL